MDGRKRPTATRSRGNSPPSQRRRQSEQSSIPDRYANAAYPRNLPSPPHSRKNSATGFSASARPGSTSNAAHERHVDQNRTNSCRNVSYSHGGPQSGAATASPRTASLGRSPISNGSGSNTPMQTAPEVPSMLPSTQKPSTSYSPTAQALNIDTLNFLRSRKTFHTASVPQGTASTTAIEIKALKAQLRLSQLGEAKLQTRIKQLEDQVEDFKTLPAQLAALKAQVEKQDRVAAPKAPGFTLGDNVAYTPFPYHVANIQQRLQAVENRIDGENGLAKIIDDIQDDLTHVEQQIHNNTRDVELCSSKFVAIFDQNFDPFRNTVEQRLETLSRHITHTSESLAKLEEQAEVQQAASSAPSLAAAQLADFEQALARLQSAVKNEAEYRDIVVQELKQQLASKQDTLSATRATDTVKAAVRNLQDQYNNITTDDLHAKMVHWFLQQYPSDSANLVQKFAGLQQEVAQLRDLANRTNWDPRQIQTLNALAQVGPQLQALAKSPSYLNGSPEMLVKTNEELTTMKEAIAKAQRENEGLSRTVGGLQISMHALNSGSTSFATTESVAVLEQSVTTLQAEITVALKEERRARNELAFKADTEHKNRVEADNSIVRSMESRFEELENGKIEAATKQVKSLQDILTKIRTEFDEMLDKFLTPTNKVLLSRLPALLIVTGQLQDLLESLNQNLPKGPLEFTWHHDFNADLSAMPAP